MKNSVNKRYVPKLRFKGFEGEYLKVYCKEISTILGVGVDKMKKQNEKIVQFVNFVDVYKNRFIDNQQDLLKTTCSDQEFKKFMLQYGDILITPSSENKTDIGLTCMINFKPINLVYSYHLNLMRFNLKIIEPLWISYYFYTNKSRKYFYKVSSGITRYTLNKNNLENFEITYPSIIDEQVKISTFLKLLDKQISLLENKLKLTEQIKDWIIEFLYKKAKQNKKIKLSEILDPRIVGHIIDLKGYTPISIMLHGKGFKENTLNVKLTKKGRKYYERFSGDLIIGLQNFHNGSIDILNDEYNKPIMSNAIASFINKSEYPLIIIKYILLSKKHQQYLINIAEGTGQKEFTINKILNSYIWIPTHDLIEKFSKFIKTLELQIRNLQIKKDFLEKNKKYYLDNLFI